MGTPEFAVASLDKLLKNKFNVVGVVTAPDKPAGRGRQLQQSDVKKYALEKGLKILQPEKLKDPLFLNELKGLKADLQIVVAFRMLPEAVWKMPALGTYNLHASLLPKYRGAAPINWAIINGERETGVTTFKLKHEIDTGNILDQVKVSISETTTAGELHDILKEEGAELLVKTTNKIQMSFKNNTKLVFMPQEEGEVCHAPKIFKGTCKINWNKPGRDIYNLIRGLSPSPGAFTEITSGTGSQILKIFNSDFEVSVHNKPNGLVLTDDKNFLKVTCAGGIVQITDLQLEGKKRMTVQEFLRGFKINTETVLS
jgi:methionyl-tRNA formyltransferase